MHNVREKLQWSSNILQYKWSFSHLMLCAPKSNVTHIKRYLVITSPKLNRVDMVNLTHEAHIQYFNTKTNVHQILTIVGITIPIMVVGNRRL